MQTTNRNLWPLGIFVTFGLFFAAIYVAAGLLLYFELFARGKFLWVIVASAGFPLLAPFTAVGLYEALGFTVHRTDCVYHGSII